MSPDLNMATSTSSFTSTSLSPYYDSKYGRITVLTGDNYTAFQASCRAALVAAGAWSITQNIELRPAQGAAAQRDWDERNRKAIQLIFSSTIVPLQSRIADAIVAEDSLAMWAELARDNKSQNPVYLNNLNTQFQTATWDPQAQSIREFVTSLESLRTQLH